MMQTSSDMGNTLDQVRDILRQAKGLEVSRKTLNTKLLRWGYTKKYRRSEHLAILREQKARDAEGKASSFTLHGRPVYLKKARAYQKRERLQLKTSYTLPISDRDLSTDLVCRTPPSNLPQGLPFIHQWRACEKLLYDSDALVRGSFEAGVWSFDGNNHLINSSPAQECELTCLNDFLGNLKIGCAVAQKQNFHLAGEHWRRAFLAIDTLVRGRYHDILPNFVQQINDLNSQGFPELARALKTQIASISEASVRQVPMSYSLTGLGQIDMTLMNDIEQRLMKHYTELFEQYLGPHCYNSFVMMMDTARRKLLQDGWSTFEDSLPSIQHLDTVFGATDRRPLDVIGLRLEILHLRGFLDQAETEASDLIRRAQMICGDEWQQLYHLTRGWYHLGCVQYVSGKRQFAVGSLTNALSFEEELSKLDSFNIFEAEKAVVQQYLNDAKISASTCTLIE